MGWHRWPAALHRDAQPIALATIGRTAAAIGAGLTVIVGYEGIRGVLTNAGTPWDWWLLDALPAAAILFGGLIAWGRGHRAAERRERTSDDLNSAVDTALVAESRLLLKAPQLEDGSAVSRGIAGARDHWLAAKMRLEPLWGPRGTTELETWVLGAGIRQDLNAHSYALTRAATRAGVTLDPVDPADYADVDARRRRLYWARWDQRHAMHARVFPPGWGRPRNANDRTATTPGEGATGTDPIREPTNAATGERNANGTED